MWNVIEWARSKVASAKNAAHDATLKWDSLKRNALSLNYENHFIPMWEAVSHVFDPRIVIRLARSEKTKWVLLEAAKSNIWYMGSVIAYEGYVQPFMSSYIPEPLMYEIPFIRKPFAECVMSLAANVYFTRLFLRNYIDNTAYGLSIYKAANIDFPRDPRDHQYMCACSDAAYIDPKQLVSLTTVLHPSDIKKYLKANERVIRAKLSSSFYYNGDMLYVSVINAWLRSVLPPYVRELSSMFGALLIARGLIEYNMSSMCTRHRGELLNKNNYYSLGFGLSLLGMANVANGQVSRLTGVKSGYVYDAIFSLAYQYFIILAMTIRRPLPGREPGIDFFRYSREKTRENLKIGTDFIFQQFRQGGAQIDWQGFLSTPTMMALRRVFLGKEYLSLDAFVKSPAINLYFDYNGEDLNKIIAFIEFARDHYIADSLYRADKKMREATGGRGIFSKNAGKVFGWVKDPRVTVFVHQVYDFIDQEIRQIELKAARAKVLDPVMWDRYQAAMRVREVEGQVRLGEPKPIMPADEVVVPVSAGSTALIQAAMGSSISVVEEYEPVKAKSVAATASTTTSQVSVSQGSLTTFASRRPDASLAANASQSAVTSHPKASLRRGPQLQQGK